VILCNTQINNALRDHTTFTKHIDSQRFNLKLVIDHLKFNEVLINNKQAKQNYIFPILRELIKIPLISIAKGLTFTLRPLSYFYG